MKDNHYIYESQKQALDMLYKYCDHTEPQMELSEIDWHFFDEFLMYWLPKNQSRLNEREVYQVLNVVGGYCAYIQEIYNIKTLDQAQVKKEYKREYLRIYQLKRLFLKHLGDPILNVKPLIIDFDIYKQYKSRKELKQTRGIYQQGLYEVIEIDYDNTIVLRRLLKGNCVRILLVDSVIACIREGDILNLRIKQKQYFAYWEVVDLKSCYLSNAGQYLTH